MCIIGKVLLTKCFDVLLENIHKSDKQRVHVSFPIIYFNVFYRKTACGDLFCSNQTFSLVGH